MINFLEIKVKNGSEFQLSSPFASYFEKPRSSKEKKSCRYRRSSPRSKSDDVDIDDNSTINNEKKHIDTRVIRDGQTNAQRCSGISDNDGNNNTRSVTFAKMAEIVYMKHQHSPKEQEDMWYNDDEYLVIQQKAAETVRLMMKCEKYNVAFTETDDQTTRGLESRTKFAAKQRKKVKSYAQQLVFSEQRYQNIISASKGSGYIANHERIRLAYSEVSSIALQQAQKQGKKDEGAVNI